MTTPTDTTANLPLLLTVEAAATLLGIGRTRMYALVKSGEVPSVLIGRSRRVPTAALQRYVDDLPIASPTNGPVAA